MSSPAKSSAVVLQVGEELSDRAVSSPNGEFTLVHQHDGNVVIYRNADGHALWASNTNFQGHIGPGDRLQNSHTGRLLLRSNGSLAVLHTSGQELWQTQPQRHPEGMTLVLSDLGMAMLLNASRMVVWRSPRPPELWRVWNRVGDGRRLRRGQTLRGQSLTSDNGEYTLVWDREGTVYLRRKDVGVLWSRNLEPGAGLVMDEEGSLDVRYPNGTVASWTEVPLYTGTAEFYVSDEGRLTLADEAGEPLWSSPSTTDESDWPVDVLRELRTSDRPMIDLADYDEFNALVVRTDFGHPDAWAKILRELAVPFPGLPDAKEPQPFLIDDPTWAGAHWEEAVSALPREDAPSVLFIADTTAMTSTGPEGHLLQAIHVDRLLEPDVAADYTDDFPGVEQGRLGAEQAETMAINLALANSDFEDFIS